jgi:hypothetical protein
MRSTRIICVLLALVVAACGFDGVASRDEGTASATSVSITGPAAEEADDGAAGPLYLGLSIHVEGWTEEAANRAMFDRHVDGLLMMAEAAATHDAVLTFEFSDVFMDAVRRWDSDVVERLHALGHGTGVHADVGGRGNPTLEELTTELTRMRDKAAAIGAETSHVSGVCSRGPWVEAVIAAGFTSVNGAVEYCATSLDPEVVPEGWDVEECRSPADCHGQLDVGLDLRIHPYLVDSSADFLSASEGGVVLMLGNSGEAIDCAAEEETGARCVGDAEDLPHAEALLEEFIEGRDPLRVAALTMSWSVGSIPSEGFVDAFLAVFDDAVAAGEARWLANGDIAAIVLGAESPPVERVVDAGSGSVLPVVISIHAHYVDDYAPYTNPSLSSLDPARMAHLQELVAETADVLEAHGAAADWQMSYGVATALCSADDTGLVERLQSLDHGIGVHLHPLADLDAALAGLSGCGIEPTTVSGLAFTTGTAASGAVEAAGEWLETVEAEGLEVVLVGIGDGTNPLDRECGVYDDVTYSSDAGALLHSWRVDAGDICTSDPAGALEIVTHAALPFGGRPGSGPPSVSANAVSERHADVWLDWLDAAIEEATPASTWGIVFPFGAISDAMGASDSFVGALESFLEALDAAVASGRVVSVTANQAAAMSG